MRMTVSSHPALAQSPPPQTLKLACRKLGMREGKERFLMYGDVSGRSVMHTKMACGEEQNPSNHILHKESTTQ